MYNRKHEKQQLRQIQDARQQARQLHRVKSWQRRGGFGLNEVIGASIAVMIAALVVVPGMRAFSEDAITKMMTWWEGISSTLFLRV